MDCYRVYINDRRHSQPGSNDNDRSMYSLVPWGILAGGAWLCQVGMSPLRRESETYLGAAFTVSFNTNEQNLLPRRAMKQHTPPTYYLLLFLHGNVSKEHKMARICLCSIIAS